MYIYIYIVYTIYRDTTIYIPAIYNSIRLEQMVR